MYVNHCAKGTHAIIDIEIPEPIDLGSDQLGSYGQDAARGMRGQISDQARTKGQFGWALNTTPATDFEKTEARIYDQVAYGLTARLVTEAGLQTQGTA